MWNMEWDVWNVECGMGDSGLGMWNIEWGFCSWMCDLGFAMINFGIQVIDLIYVSWDL